MKLSFNAGPRFESALCFSPLLSAAVAHPDRSTSQALVRVSAMRPQMTAATASMSSQSL